MDPLRFAKFEFEETEVDGVVYRLPVIDLKKEVFQAPKRKQKNNKEDDVSRYKFAQQFYRNVEDEEEQICQPSYQVNVGDGMEEIVDAANDLEEQVDFEADKLASNDKEDQSSLYKEALKKESPVFVPKIKKETQFDTEARQFTHCLYLPVTSKQLSKKLVDFQYKVESFDGGKSLYDQWFVEESTFHFTLLLLPLTNKEAVSKAAEVIQALQPELEKFLADKDFVLTVRGVGHFTMPGQADESSVLYAEIAENKHYDTLVDLTDMIIKRMLLENVIYENELGFIEYDEQLDKYFVKFHLSLINTSLFKIEGEYIGFQGKPIVEKFKNENFGTFKPKTISLSRRKAVDGAHASSLARVTIPTDVEITIQ
eukprot:CAMPEP_0168343170 /NCGR_PEP_ID=MMETSP0213-20121227/15891_1 /TAXON_ID=151035 /ORGANISM="Euplotes harpa, Strain FSP1.4" /LENGTH=368 /DNA_ID=CAMNT_0008350329 /DNA_START=11 /DNA_END=1117 /DNA_ORIENTATION=-